MYGLKKLAFPTKFTATLSSEQRRFLNQFILCKALKYYTVTIIQVFPNLSLLRSRIKRQVRDIPARDGKIASPFLQCTHSNQIILLME